MSHNNSDDNGDNSNDNQHSKQQIERKMPDYDYDWVYQQQVNPSPRFTPIQQYQMQQHFTSIPQFNLQEKSYEDYGEPKQPQINSDRKGQSTYPFRKHSIGEGQQIDHLEPIDDNHRQVQYTVPHYYQQPMKFQPQMMMSHKYPQPPPMPPQMQPSQPYMYPQQHWYRQQQYCPPFYCYQPYDNNQYQHTLSKELQNKVYQLVQTTKVSEFQCNCKKSKCLKLYCECFANNWVCSQSCNCQECKNRIDNQSERAKAIEEALLRNQEAFSHYFQNRMQQHQPQQTPIQESKQKELVKETSKITRKGCNCKKSGCKKKYCECFSQNLTCSDICKCENCQNKTDAEIQAAKGTQDQSVDNIKVTKSTKKAKNTDNNSDSKEPINNNQFQTNTQSSSKKKKQEKSNA